MINSRTLMLTTAFILSTGLALAQPKVIAHRGFWKTDGSAQNSIAALVKADSIGCYGSEFDVWLTKDNKLVVNHDPMFKGRFMQKTTNRKLTQIKLNNGENLPTLKAYLKKAKELPGIELILELKPHGRQERETKAVELILQTVKEYGLEGRTQYIAFSLHATKEFIRLAPAGTPVYYLDGNLSPKELKEIGCAGLDYNIKVLEKHPQWIKEAHELGLKANAWTVNDEKSIKWLISQGVDFITTNDPVLAQSLIGE